MSPDAIFDRQDVMERIYGAVKEYRGTSFTMDQLFTDADELGDRLQMEILGEMRQRGVFLQTGPAVGIVATWRCDMDQLERYRQDFFAASSLPSYSSSERTAQGSLSPYELRATNAVDTYTEGITHIHPASGDLAQGLRESAEQYARETVGTDLAQGLRESAE
ncbi:hypothetical protein J2X68_008128, partial [Streptomyces sp. 3330]|uniref:hypothetical protein n=1 Tax=Streptomyces sp. 3330 TaxID=2817755 RepID=UPI0028581102